MADLHHRLVMLRDGTVRALAEAGTIDAGMLARVADAESVFRVLPVEPVPGLRAVVRDSLGENLALMIYGDGRGTPGGGAGLAAAGTGDRRRSGRGQPALVAEGLPALGAISARPGRTATTNAVARGRKT